MSDNKSPLTQLVYASAATVPFNHEELETLLVKARCRNETLSVTGVLLFKDETFFQVLEGPPNSVDELYAKISLDPRHDNVLLLARNQVDSRNFGEWRMGYVRDPQEIAQLPGFVDFFAPQGFIELAGDSRRMKQILAGFQRGRWRRTCSQGPAPVAN